jgi:uncharacterized lipoprotein YbaY
MSVGGASGDPNLRIVLQTTINNNNKLLFNIIEAMETVQATAAGRLLEIMQVILYCNTTL